MKRLSLGILAHVDAGKTTLSEAMLYESGSIRKLGRVDNKNAFLDTESLERERGITIFSKQAVMQYEDTVITLLDTPGHVDFSAEMERTLWVMDYAVLVISGSDGIQGHTRTLWKLLDRYNVPVFLFVNKMDQPDTDKEKLLGEFRKELGEGFVDFGINGEDFAEQIAVCDEELLERYLESGEIDKADIKNLIKMRKVFPCFFGSALKVTGVKEFMDGLVTYSEPDEYDKDAFKAKVFKIARDPQGNRLTYLKVTGGVLKVKDVIDGGEKVNQIRIYSGNSYEAVPEITAGGICAVTGPGNTVAGTGLGKEAQGRLPVLEPVMTYSVKPPADSDSITLLSKLKILAEEFPELAVSWQEKNSEIQVKLMGEVQIDVLKKTICDRFGIVPHFGEGNIVYKETICDVVEGVGHFEPLRHYAEVHLKLEPAEEGTGIQALLDCSEDVLDKNWQRLIMTHIEEKEHIGVLGGFPLTDVRITVVAGRAHTKHTEGGDFRQATYRAIRQGLMQAKCRILEPYYSFTLDVPVSCVGRAMTDMENMCAGVNPPETDGEMAHLTGVVPVSTVKDYQITVNSYTKGKGNLALSLKGYGSCHNEEEVIERSGYNPDDDTDNPSSSVFCAHGSGYIVPWYEVKENMHVESVMDSDNASGEAEQIKVIRAGAVEEFIDDEQIEGILNRTYRANENVKKNVYKRQKPAPDTKYKGKEKPRNKKRYLIIDGYNIIHAWDELNVLLKDNIDGARMKLVDMLANYQAFMKVKVVVVFDGYKVKGNAGESYDYNGIKVVYTKEAETADSYIEKMTHDMSKDYHVMVATSDGLVQLITGGQNCTPISARELREEIERANRQIREYLDND